MNTFLSSESLPKREGQFGFLLCLMVGTDRAPHNFGQWGEKRGLIRNEACDSQECSSSTPISYGEPHELHREFSISLGTEESQVSLHVPQHRVHGNSFVWPVPPPVLCFSSLGAPAPGTVLFAYQAFRTFCVNVEHSTLPTRMGFIIEINSPLLIFKEKRRNALQARKLGAWEGFWPGDFFFFVTFRPPSPFNLFCYFFVRWQR